MVQTLVDGMAVPLFLDPSTVYFLYAGTLLLGGVVIALLSLRESGQLRRLILVGAIPALAMGSGYVLMGLELFTVTTAGREQSVARFIAYSFVLLSATYLIKVSVDLTRRQFAKILAILLAIPWTALVSWLFEGTANSVLTLLSLVMYIVAAYVLLRPLNRIAQQSTSDRTLFYEKIRNLFILCWGVLTLMSATSEQTLGLTDTFVAQIGAGYADIVLMFGIGVLVIASRSLFEERPVESADETATQRSGTAPVDD